jgi:hypothetical protein
LAYYYYYCCYLTFALYTKIYDESKLKPFSFDTTTVMTTAMDGYEYEAKVLWPMWNKDSEEQLEREKARRIKAQSAGTIDSITKERLKKELGIEVRDPIEDIGGGLSNRMFKSPSNFIPELSSDNLVWDLGRRFRNQR